MLVHEFLTNSRINFPHKLAVKTRNEVLTFTEMDEKSNQIANYLIKHGLKKGDRVAIWMDNSINTCLSIYGVLKAGGVFVVVNPTTKSQKLEYIVNDCQACFIFSQSHIIKNAKALLSNLPSVSACIVENSDENKKTDYLSFSDIFSAQPGDNPKVRIIDCDLASLIYTSGSTGNPKGVMMTHLNMVSALRSITTYLENVTEDIVINVLPLSFDYGLYQLLMTVSFSGTLILEKGFVYPQELVQRIIDEQVTGFPGVPTIFAMLFKMSDILSYDFSQLRYISNTGAALPAEFIQKLGFFFPGTAIYSMYGLTECKRVAYLHPSLVNKFPTSVGIAMPNCEVYIVDDEGDEVGPGVIGELVVRGSNVMQGYWNLDELTAKVLKHGKHQFERALFSGDLFYKDKNGLLYFVARKDDIIKSRGEKVSPKEVEEVLYILDEVAEAAIIGVDDDILGQAIKAFVVTKNGQHIDEKFIIAHCKKYLENFAVPKYVVFRSHLPHNNNGKVDKKQLAK